jgi:hypothetical protein
MLNPVAKEFKPKARVDPNIYPVMTPVAIIVPSYYAGNPVYLEHNLPIPEYVPPAATNSVPLPQADPAVVEAKPQQEKIEEKPQYRNDYKQREDGGKIKYVQKKKVEKKADEQVDTVKENVEKKILVEKIAPETEKPKVEEIIEKEKQPESKKIFLV